MDEGLNQRETDAFNFTKTNYYRQQVSSSYFLKYAISVK